MSNKIVDRIVKAYVPGKITVVRSNYGCGKLEYSRQAGKIITGKESYIVGLSIIEVSKTNLDPEIAKMLLPDDIARLINIMPSGTSLVIYDYKYVNQMSIHTMNQRIFETVQCEKVGPVFLTLQIDDFLSEEFIPYIGNTVTITVE